MVTFVGLVVWKCFLLYKHFQDGSAGAPPEDAEVSPEQIAAEQALLVSLQGEGLDESQVPVDQRDLPMEAVDETAGEAPLEAAEEDSDQTPQVPESQNTSASKKVTPPLPGAAQRLSAKVMDREKKKKKGPQMRRPAASASSSALGAQAKQKAKSVKQTSAKQKSGPPKKPLAKKPAGKQGGSSSSKPSSAPLQMTTKHVYSRAYHAEDGVAGNLYP